MSPLTTESPDRGRPPGPPAPLRAFGLRCVQGLWGGCALWAAEDCTAVVQVVDRGMWEKRYRTRITHEQWAEVERLVGAHHFLAFKARERNGLPDEARPVIFLVTAEGESASASQWEGDAHPDFDPVYAYLRALCREDGELVREGPYEALQLEGSSVGNVG